MNNCNDLVIRISPDTQRIQVESQDKGVTAVKEISIDTFLECIKSSRVYEEQVCSGFLPQNCFHITVCTDGSRDYCIWHPRLSADISYYGTVYTDFPLPRLVFGIRVSKENKIRHCRLGVVKDAPPRENTPMFVYPFSNVSGFGLCVGNNALPAYRNRSTLATLPDYLLRLPNNNDSFSAKNNRLHLPYRELLEHLKKKDSAYYYSDVLIPSGKTLNDFINGR